MKLNDYAKLCHKANQKWWYHIDTGEKLERNKGELLMLMVSELSECMEGERKNLMDDKLPHRRMSEVEIVDFLIRAFDFCAGFEWDLEDAISYRVDQPFLNLHAKHMFLECKFQGVDLSENFGLALLVIVSNISKSFDFIVFKYEPIAQTYLGDAIVFALAYSHKWNYDLDGAFKDKMAFNATREDHQHEARRLAHGKKF